jgi:hypothetical protein
MSWMAEMEIAPPNSIRFRLKLQDACPGGLQPLGAKSNFVAYGCDIKTLSMNLVQKPGSVRIGGAARARPSF